jgi:hypothetical protein
MTEMTESIPTVKVGGYIDIVISGALVRLMVTTVEVKASTYPDFTPFFKAVIEATGTPDMQPKPMTVEVVTGVHADPEGRLSYETKNLTFNNGVLSYQDESAK